MISKRDIKILSAVTVSESVIFFYGMPSFLLEKGYKVAISASDGPEMKVIHENERAEIFRVEMEREINIPKDLASLFRVLKVLVKYRPDVINTGTPKAGLLYLIGAWILRTPIRIYHVRGLRHESLCGLKEKFQIFIERLCGKLATHIICETKSLEQLALEQHLFPRVKTNVLGPGSSGVELENYNPDDFSESYRCDVRSQLGIPGDAIVIGFLGRVVPRKGVSELLESWVIIRERYPNTYLLIVGPFEGAQPIDQSDVDLIDTDPRIVFPGRVYDTAKYYSVMDVFTLPAHWEGFGNVLVEAAAMGLPIVTTNGTGTRDAVSDGYNARIVPIKDSDALTEALSFYLEAPDIRAEHGNNGKIWAAQFERKVILQHLADFYDKLISDNDIR
jgi:glycosyltransferase involved in cell wall biosynthesis